MLVVVVNSCVNVEQYTVVVLLQAVVQDVVHSDEQIVVVDDKIVVSQEVKIV